MSKIICEICGTVYPENATQCPICGYPRSIGENSEASAQQETAAGGRRSEPVRGGRFSTRNVKKRNKQQARQQRAEKQRPPKQEQRPRQEEPEQEPEQEPEFDSGYAQPAKNGNRGLVIAIVILLIAIILVSAYIAIRFFNGADAYNNGETTLPTETSAETTLPEPSEVVCTDIVIADVDLAAGVEFTGENRAWKLNATPVPVSTTEEMTVTSSDESVVAVSVEEDWVELVSVGPGSATITVSCGSVTKEFTVYCTFGDATEETTEPTEESTEETTEPTETTEPEELPGELELNRSDITFYTKNETFTFSAGADVKNSQVVWSSSNESVVTIVNGKATAVGAGTAKITAEYNGKTDSCIIRCSFDDGDSGSAGSGTWSISHSDVSITVGESFRLRLKNSDGETADVSWSVSGSAASVSGNTVTGQSAGTVTVSCTYDGETYECIVRVAE